MCLTYDSSETAHPVLYYNSSKKPTSCSFFSRAACTAKLFAALVAFALLAFAVLRTLSLRTAQLRPWSYKHSNWLIHLYQIPLL
jgi:hypothetical protein